MTSKQIRQQFLDFFAGKGHAIVESSPVVPHDDPTLMFANAGMNQFKDVFLGTGSRPYRRAADTQKCIRAGGKHNDLDDVGQDTYHHTFFEMLGNWSFGDYFKRDAIAWAWELLTEVFGIDKTRLHATYFEGDQAEGLEPDSEAAELWRTVTDINPDQIHPGNKKDNFWEMGDTGPCGPCSEIHIDLTPDKSGASLVNAGDARVIEIWNLVFIQFNRSSGGTLSPLPAKHVDTGMGFERLCAVLQSKSSNYDTDVWKPLFDAIQQRTGAPAYTGLLPGADVADDQRSQLMTDVSYRVIADHVRCLTFALTDGAIPSNEGRGYVLRRILRRAVRYGRQYLGMHESFLVDLVPAVVEQMSDTFPELRTAHNGRNLDHVQSLIRDEEESFGRTLDRGIKLFDEAAEQAVRHHHGRIAGEDAFKLHDTYGFPIDLTQLMAEERGLTVDSAEYERLMEEARELARSAGKIEHPELVGSLEQYTVTDFLGYRHLEVADTRVEAVLVGDQLQPANEMRAGQRGALILAATPFYAEAGGQVGDVGHLYDIDGQWTFAVQDTQAIDGRYVHFGQCEQGVIPPASAGPRARAVVEERKRRPTMQHHTSTHMLNWALREVLGDHVQQKGSLVDPDKTRFDFSHPQALTTEQLARVEDLVNDQIDADEQVYIKEVDQARAREINTLRAVFGEKYPDRVRVMSIGADIDAMLADPQNEDWLQCAVEFCGGTHLARSGEAECFALVSEEAVAKGVRRVVGICGQRAREARRRGAELLEGVTALLAEPTGDLEEQAATLQKQLAELTLPVHIRQQLREKLAELQKLVKAQEKEAASASGEAVMERVAALLGSAEAVGGVAVVIGEVPAAPTDALRGAIDWLRNKTDASAVLLTCSEGEKVTLIAGMSKDVVSKGVKAGDLIKEVAPLVGGRGGGRPDMAQGGGSDPAGIPAALDRAKAWLTEKL